MSEKFPENQPEIAEKYVANYQQLQEIWSILQELGLTPTNYPAEVVQSQWDMGSTFPIVNEGAQGIRVTRSRRGELTVSFTNGFEDRENQKRAEVTERLRERGFSVV